MNNTLTALSAALFLTLAAAPAPAPSAAYHFALSKSEPSADATVAAPAEIRLWFTEAPEDESVAIRITAAGDRLVETGDVTRDPADGKVFSSAIPGPLAAGRYTVAWRGIGDDGHVARGDFSFTVTAQ